MSYICLFPAHLILKTFLKIQFNRYKTVYYKTMTNYVCSQWDILEQVWVS